MFSTMPCPLRSNDLVNMHPSPFPCAEMTVTYTLTDGNGGTDLFAVHHNLPPGISPSDNEMGWRMSLDKLGAFVEDGAL
jgi:hypothetical protein